MRAATAIDIEDIGEIRAETHAQRHLMPAQVEIADLQQLVIGRAPDELAPIEIDQLAMQLAAIGGNCIGIGQIDRQHRAVLGRVRAQQQRAVAVEAQFELRQEPRILVIKPVGAAGLADHVPELVQHAEGFAMLQDAGARLAKRPSRLDAELRFVFGRLGGRNRHDGSPTADV